eukprot:13911584-Alexandrium_andersonii.AAC.1
MQQCIRLLVRHLRRFEACSPLRENSEHLQDTRATVTQLLGQLGDLTDSSLRRRGRPELAKTVQQWKKRWQNA